MNNYADFAGVREQIIANAVIIYKEAVSEFQQHLFNHSRSYIPRAETFDVVITTTKRRSHPNAPELVNGYEALLMTAEITGVPARVLLTGDIAYGNDLASSRAPPVTTFQALTNLLHKSSNRVAGMLPTKVEVLPL